MARKPLIIGNWKMHLTHLEGIQLVQRTTYHLDDRDHDAVDVAVAPPHTALRSVQTLIDADRLRLGLAAQDCHEHDDGAHTGEVAAPMLAALDVGWVLCGHSERRAAGEDDARVAAKAAAVRRHGMTPVVCVGETAEERDDGRVEQVVGAQLDAALGGLDAERAASTVIAYEPVWAIGTGRTATPDDAEEVCALIRSRVAGHAGEQAAERVRILYGGSVKPGNAARLMEREPVDGLLVGGASLEADAFAAICRFHRAS